MKHKLIIEIEAMTEKCGKCYFRCLTYCALFRQWLPLGTTEEKPLRHPNCLEAETEQLKKLES